MPYIVTIEVLIDVPTESEAMDAISESMRPLMKPFNDSSCLRDWRYAEDIARSNIEETATAIPNDFAMDNVWPDPI